MNSFICQYSISISVTSTYMYRRNMTEYKQSSNANKNPVGVLPLPLEKEPYSQPYPIIKGYQSFLLCHINPLDTFVYLCVWMPYLLEACLSVQTYLCQILIIPCRNDTKMGYLELSSVQSHP